MSITNIGRTGLLAAQAGISMSARNTANLMTPGYSRQGLLLTPKSTGGVGVGSLIRFADNYRTQQLWTANTQRGQYSVGESYYKQLEGVMGLEDGSVKAGIDAFFGALDEVSTDPTSSALRLQVLSKADGLAKSFNSLRQAMSRQLDTVRQQSMATADQVNALSGTIADLNQKIAAAEASGAGAPSELLDQRDLAIDTLSGLVDIRVLRQPDGTIDVSLAAGPPLVAAGQVGKISVQTNTDGSFSYSMAFNGTDYPLDGERVGGELGGLSNYATQTLQPQMESMKTLAIELATRINDQLAAGFGTNGNPGIPLFDIDPNTGELKLNPNIKQEDLGFSGNATDPGNSDNLLKLIELRKDKITLPGLGEVSLGDAYTMLVGKLGSASQQNKASLATAGEIREQAELAWLSVSGVSSEDEVVNISEYLNMYQANMKVISVANDLFTSTINMF